jgi:bacterioferritin-associated ferredoxin
MACLLHPAPEGVLEDAPPVAGGFASRVPAPMTRCECAEISFAEVARQVAQPGGSLDEVGRRTGCGQTCTACVKDLRRFLASSL